MKKLKIALTLLFALSCSLFLFACGGDKYISRIEFSGQKTSFEEGEAFSVGDLKVTAYYQGSDKAVELKPSEYDVDSSRYDSSVAGEYVIYVTPKNQPKDLTEENLYTKSYNVSVDHKWVDDGKGGEVCQCGAVRSVYKGLEDAIHTVAWGNPAELTRGSTEATTYPNIKAPIAGENHVAYDTLVRGQSMKLELQLTGLGTESSDAWYTPLMGIRNAGDGMIPREDGWVINVAAGFHLPEVSNIPSNGGAPIGGIAEPVADENDESLYWQVYGEGETWSSYTDFYDKENDKWSTITLEYVYQNTGVFMIRHTLHKYDGTQKVYTWSTAVPEASYELVCYGEFCDYTITEAEFVAGRKIEKYEITSEPAALYQPQGKLFDSTGLNTKATFSGGSTLEGSYNMYAYRDITPAATDENPSPAAVPTRINLATEPLQPDMYDFHADFNGMQAYLTVSGEPTDPSASLSDKLANSKIHVVATAISGANASPIPCGSAQFENTDVVYDYAIKTGETGETPYIRLTANGVAANLNEAQKSALGGDVTHFIAFKVVTTLGADGFDTVSVPESLQNVVVKAEKKGATVDVVVGLKSGFEGFDITLKKANEAVSTFYVDLSGINSTLATAWAEVTHTDFTLDKGGTFTVEYKGLDGTLDDYVLVTLVNQDTVKTVKEQADKYVSGKPDKEHGYFVSNTLYITKVEKGTNSVSVTYWLDAPDLGNITGDTAYTVEIRKPNSTDTLASAKLKYQLAVSEDVIDLGGNVYAKSSNQKLQLFSFWKTEDIRSGLAFEAALNIQHPFAEDEEGNPVKESYVMSYNLGVKLENGAAVAMQLNDLTSNSGTKIYAALFGTADNSDDYDTGVILVISAHLPAIGTRSGTSNRTAKYYFTANEDTDRGEDEYTVYKVEENTITEETLTPGAEAEREVFSPFTCLQNGTSAYYDETRDFYYGALISYATGKHVWDNDAAQKAECTICHAIKYREEGDANHSYEFIALPAGTPYLNTDYSDAWWQYGDNGGTSAAIDVSGNFVISYAWTNTRDANWYQDVVLEFAGANDTGFDMNFLVGQGAWAFPGGSIYTGTVQNSFTKNGGEVPADEFDADNKLAQDESVSGRWGGEYRADIYRVGDKITVVQQVVNNNGDKYGAVTVFPGVTVTDINIRLAGNQFWVDNIRRDTGVIVTTTKNITDMVFGTEGNGAGYTGDGKNDSSGPLWHREIKPGMKVTLTGAQTTTANDVWTGALPYIYVRDEASTDGHEIASLNFRPDNYINDCDEGGAQTPEAATKAAYGFKIKKGNVTTYKADGTPEADWFATFKPVKANCTATLTWDWSVKSKIVVSVYYKAESGASFEVIYELTPITAFESSYEIGVGIDGAYFVVTEMSVME